MIDFHCHLDLYPDPAAVTRRCARDGCYVLSVTTTPNAWRGTSALADEFPRIRTALGLHPQLAHERLGELALFEALLPEACYVGEVGLDGSPELKVHAKAQRDAFHRILAATAKAGGRIMSIHSRRAASDVLDALAARPDAGVPVLHWFSGTKAELERAVAMGCWFSVGPAMLAGSRGAALVSAMPMDRVLTETDGPFGTGRAGNPLWPGQVEPALERLSGIWRMDVASARQRVMASFRTLVASAVPGGALRS